MNNFSHIYNNASKTLNRALFAVGSIMASGAPKARAGYIFNFKYLNSQ